ncbi:MAG: hypothetical protein RIR01_663, partial [Bacteroidota bacterium]
MKKLIALLFFIMPALLFAADIQIVNLK